MVLNFIFLPFRNKHSFGPGNARLLTLGIWHKTHHLYVSPFFLFKRRRHVEVIALKITLKMSKGQNTYNIILLVIVAVLSLFLVRIVCRKPISNCTLILQKLLFCCLCKMLHALYLKIWAIKNFIKKKFLN